LLLISLRERLKSEPEDVLRLMLSLDDLKSESEPLLALRFNDPSLSSSAEEDSFDLRGSSDLAFQAA
jgi:hypothetical protein